MAVIDAINPPTGRFLEAFLTTWAVGLSVGAYALVGLGTTGALPPGMLGYGTGLALLTLMLHLAVRRFARYADPTLLPIATALNGIGLVMIHRLDLHYPSREALMSSFAFKQLIWTALGIAAATVIVARLADHRTLRRYTYVAMAAGLLLLLLPLTPVLGTNINGARIWIRVGGLSFQPGELAKIALTIFFAGYLVSARDSLSLVGRRVLGLQLPRGRDFGPLVLAWLITLGVLVFERDLGTSLLFFGLFVGMLYVATERFSWVVIGLGMFGAGAVLAGQVFSHVQRRVEIWLHPFDPETLPYATQIVQGLFGMAAGGLLGTGWGQGRPYDQFAAESDMILASLGEELGLTGVIVILALYALLVERGLRTAIGVRDGFGKLLAGGLAFSMALQVFVVAGGVTRVIPLTGLTMPFLAYGGSSLVANWMIVALLLRISDSARRPPPSTTGLALDLPGAAAAPLPPRAATGDQATEVVRG